MRCVVEPVAERAPAEKCVLRCEAGSGAVLEAPAVVAGFDDLTVVGQTVEKRGSHLGVTEDARPFAEGEIGGDDDGGALLKPADEMEEKPDWAKGK